jgi:hypothetical protein
MFLLRVHAGSGLVGTRIGESRLRMVLYLLERCGMLDSVTKKIYYVPESGV